MSTLRASLATPESAAEQVRTTMFRILAVLRLVVLLYAVYVNYERLDRMARPDLAWVALAAMTVWTLVAGAFYELRRDRPVWFYVLDVA
ncbi:MAG TPA: hypothetical protein VFY58_09555, partial [Nocardioides sp.]|nr:hypothetical protein [Nocardioides sp.]